MARGTHHVPRMLGRRRSSIGIHSCGKGKQESHELIRSTGFSRAGARVGSSHTFHSMRTSSEVIRGRREAHMSTAVKTLAALLGAMSSRRRKVAQCLALPLRVPLSSPDSTRGPHGGVLRCATRGFQPGTAFAIKRAAQDRITRFAEFPLRHHPLA